MSPVIDLRVCSTGPFLKLCWFPPSFYSNIPKGSDPTYYIQLAGDDTIYDTTTNTFYEFNVSLPCNTLVNVTASVGDYMSSRDVTNNGELICLNITLAHALHVMLEQLVLCTCNACDIVYNYATSIT